MCGKARIFFHFLLLPLLQSEKQSDSKHSQKLLLSTTRLTGYKASAHLIAMLKPVQ